MKLILPLFAALVGDATACAFGCKTCVDVANTEVTSCTRCESNMFLFKEFNKDANQLINTCVYSCKDISYNFVEDIDNKQCLDLGSYCMAHGLNEETQKYECRFSQLQNQGYIFAKRSTVLKQYLTLFGEQSVEVQALSPLYTNSNIDDQRILVKCNSPECGICEQYDLGFCGQCLGIFGDAGNWQSCYEKKCAAVNSVSCLIAPADCSTCTLCDYGLYLNAGKCQKCSDIDRNCEVCTSEQGNFDCKLCKEGYGFDPDSKICKPCSISNVKTCKFKNGIESIGVCKTNFYQSFSGTSCVSKCKTNEFVDSPTIDPTFGFVTKLQCNQCHSSCLTCIQSNSDQSCTKCASFTAVAIKHPVLRSGTCSATEVQPIQKLESIKLLTTETFNSVVSQPEYSNSLIHALIKAYNQSLMFKDVTTFEILVMPGMHWIKKSHIDEISILKYPYTDIDFQLANFNLTIRRDESLCTLSANLDLCLSAPAVINNKVGSQFQIQVPTTLTIENLIFDSLDSQQSLNYANIEEKRCFYDSSNVRPQCKDEEPTLNLNQICRQRAFASLFQMMYSSKPRYLKIKKCVFQSFLYEMGSLVRVPKFNSNATWNIDISDSTFQNLSFCGALFSNDYQIDTYQNSVAMTQVNNLFSNVNEVEYATTLKNLIMTNNTIQRLNAVKTTQQALNAHSVSQDYLHFGLLLHLANFSGTLNFQDNKVSDLMMIFDDQSCNLDQTDQSQKHHLFYVSSNPKQSSNVSFMNNQVSKVKVSSTNLVIESNQKEDTVQIRNNTFNESTSYRDANFVQISLLTDQNNSPRPLIDLGENSFLNLDLTCSGSSFVKVDCNQERNVSFDLKISKNQLTNVSLGSNLTVYKLNNLTSFAFTDSILSNIKGNANALTLVESDEAASYFLLSNITFTNFDNTSTRLLEGNQTQIQVEDLSVSNSNMIKMPLLTVKSDFKVKGWTLINSSISSPILKAIASQVKIENFQIQSSKQSGDCVFQVDQASAITIMNSKLDIQTQLLCAPSNSNLTFLQLSQNEITSTVELFKGKYSRIAKLIIEGNVMRSQAALVKVADQGLVFSEIQLSGNQIETRGSIVEFANLSEPVKIVDSDLNVKDKVGGSIFQLSKTQVEVQNCSFEALSTTIFDSQPDASLKIQACSFKNISLPNLIRANSVQIKDSNFTDFASFKLMVSRILITSSNFNTSSLQTSLSIESPSVKVDNCTFSKNTLQVPDMNNGSFIKVKAPASIVSISQCTFMGGFALNGGAVYSQVSQLQLEIVQTIFKNNRALSRGGAVCVDAIESPSFIKVTECQFTNNSAGVEGDQVWVKSNAIKNVDLTLSEVKFDSSSGSGQVFLDHISNLNLQGVDFLSSGNKTAAQGGSISCRMCTNVSIANSSFKKSNSMLEGGAVYLTNGENLSIQKTVFEENFSLKGGAVFVKDFAIINMAETDFRSNSVMMLNSTEYLQYIESIKSDAPLYLYASSEIEQFRVGKGPDVYQDCRLSNCLFTITDSTTTGSKVINSNKSQSVYYTSSAPKVVQSTILKNGVTPDMLESVPIMSESMVLVLDDKLLRSSYKSKQGLRPRDSQLYKLEQGELDKILQTNDFKTGNDLFPENSSLLLRDAEGVETIFDSQSIVEIQAIVSNVELNDSTIKVGFSNTEPALRSNNFRLKAEDALVHLDKLKLYGPPGLKLTVALTLWSKYASINKTYSFKILTQKCSLGQSVSQNGQCKECQGPNFYSTVVPADVQLTPFNCKMCETNVFKCLGGSKKEIVMGYNQILASTYNISSFDENLYLKCRETRNGQTTCLDNNQCLSGYTGIQCNTCQKEYQRTFDGMCKICEPFWYVFVQIIASWLFWVIWLILAFKLLNIPNNNSIHFLRMAVNFVAYFSYFAEDLPMFGVTEVVTKLYRLPWISIDLQCLEEFNQQNKTYVYFGIVTFISLTSCIFACNQPKTIELESSVHEGGLPKTYTQDNEFSETIPNSSQQKSEMSIRGLTNNKRGKTIVKQEDSKTQSLSKPVRFILIVVFTFNIQLVHQMLMLTQCKPIVNSLDNSTINYPEINIYDSSLKCENDYFKYLVYSYVAFWFALMPALLFRYTKAQFLLEIVSYLNKLGITLLKLYLVSSLFEAITLIAMLVLYLALMKFKYNSSLISSQASLKVEAVMIVSLLISTVLTLFVSNSSQQIISITIVAINAAFCVVYVVQACRVCKAELRQLCQSQQTQPATQAYEEKVEDNQETQEEMKEKEKKPKIVNFVFPSQESQEISKIISDRKVTDLVSSSKKAAGNYSKPFGDCDSGMNSGRHLGTSRKINESLDNPFEIDKDYVFENDLINKDNANQNLDANYVTFSHKKPKTLMQYQQQLNFQEFRMILNDAYSPSQLNTIGDDNHSDDLDEEQNLEQWQDRKEIYFMKNNESPKNLEMKSAVNNVLINRRIPTPSTYKQEPEIPIFDQLKQTPLAKWKKDSNSHN